MQLSVALTALMAIAMTVSPAFAIPKAIPELEIDDHKVTCHPGKHLVGAGCSPEQRFDSSCSADQRSVVACVGHGPTWHVINHCQRGICNNNCVCN